MQLLRVAQQNQECISRATDCQFNCGYPSAMVVRLTLFSPCWISPAPLTPHILFWAKPNGRRLPFEFPYNAPHICPVALHFLNQIKTPKIHQKLPVTEIAIMQLQGLVNFRRPSARIWLGGVICLFRHCLGLNQYMTC